MVVKAELGLRSVIYANAIRLSQHPTNRLSFRFARDWMARYARFMRRVVVSLVVFSLSLVAVGAEEATFDGATLSVPSVSVEGAYYSISLNLLHGSDPV